MKRVRFVGVHHRHQLSIANVEDTIFEEKPGIVCVELPPDDYLKFLEVRFYLETEFKIAMISGCDIGARIFLIDWEKKELKIHMQKLIPHVNNREIWEKFDDGNVPAFLRLIKKESFNDLKKVQRVLLKE